METNNYEAAIEAILFTMGESVEIDKIAKALELTKAQVKKIVANKGYSNKTPMLYLAKKTAK